MKNTKKHEPSLKLYTVLLRLYPEHFRKKYEEQLLLTAADILTNSNSTGAVALATIRLYADTISNALHVRLTHTDTLRPQLRGTTPRSAFHSFLFALEASAILLFTFIWSLQAKAWIEDIGLYVSRTDFTFVQQVSQILTGFLLLAYLPLALVATAKYARLPLRLTIRWAYIFAVAGTISFLLLVTVLPRLFPMNAFANGSSDLLVTGAYTCMYYFAVRQYAQKLASKRAYSVTVK